VVILPTPKPIGGRVVDQAGEPIEGVTVRVFASSYGPRLQSAVWDFPCKTDAEGRWSCPVAPSSLRRLRIHVEHPEYVSDQFYGKAPFIEDLQTRVHIGVMRKRVTVRGSVTGSDGKPVAKATVYLGSKLSSGVPRETETDQEGRYAFTNCTEGEKKLKVFTKNLAPELVELTVDEDFAGPVDVELTSGETVSIKVVDHKGDPIAQAQIVFNGWRGLSSLYDKNLSSLVTDENGIFVLENAPEGDVMFDVRAPGFQNQGWVKHAAGEEPVIAKLFCPVFASGSVVNAETGKPIERFTIACEHHESSGRVTSTRRKVVDGKGGRYAFELTRPSDAYRLVIKADGYAPQRSPLFKRGEGEVSFSFKLGQTYGVQGKVVSPDGLPVDGATVALTAKKFQTLRLNNGRIENLDNFVSASTKADGCFSLVADKKAWLVYVCHELGFARIDGAFSEAGHEVKLSPWVTISGKDLKNVGSEDSVEFVLVGKEKVDKRIKQQATTNTDGEFEFKRVVPNIQYSIGRVTNFTFDGKRRRKTQVVASLNAVAGVHVLLGQPGRKITGELGYEGWRIAAAGFAKAKVQLPDYPEGYDQWDESRRNKWQEQWDATEKGIRYQTGRCLEYPLKFTDEHHFEIEAVPPGFYEIEIELDTGRGDSFLKKHKLHVKKITAEEKDPQPQDLGVIEFSHPSSDD